MDMRALTGPLIDLSIGSGISVSRAILRGFSMGQACYGRIADGIAVQAFTLAAGKISATILEPGDTITARNVADAQGRTCNLVLGLKDLAPMKPAAS
jgi:hypothetical protein